MNQPPTPHQAPPQRPAPPPPNPPSKTALAIWLGLAVLATLIGGVGIGIAAYDSESAGVTASYLVTGPVGFFWGAAVGAILGFTALKNRARERKLAPPGCGCGCGLILALGLFVFMVAIFPSL